MLIALLFCGVCHADQDPPKHIRVSIQFIEMAHPVMTELLGGEEKGGAAIHAKAMTLLKTGDAKILETIMVIARSGQKATVESIGEEMYPSEYQYFTPTCGMGAPYSFLPMTREDPVAPALRSLIGFETKNTGITLEVEPTLGMDGVTVDLRFIPEFVRRLRLDTFKEHKDQWGDASLRMPVYERWKSNSSLTLQAGKFQLATVINPKDQAPPPAISRRILLFVRADVVETPVGP